MEKGVAQRVRTRVDLKLNSNKIDRRKSTSSAENESVQSTTFPGNLRYLPSQLIIPKLKKISKRGSFPKGIPSIGFSQGTTSIGKT
jgi:hypothetical protein